VFHILLVSVKKNNIQGYHLGVIVGHTVNKWTNGIISCFMKKYILSIAEIDPLFLCWNM